ncbi:serine protease inhibitor ecotin [uncultured Shewanella sp.]|uniref:serine protease inhibitor ecotin n=1 Tax=uncultured Shewanella sp. TaxID=173975 RepID=UPI0026129037|nr:serine protease inhibitor ecotin [uncultured Shewanella sp.]
MKILTSPFQPFTLNRFFSVAISTLALLSFSSAHADNDNIIGHRYNNTNYQVEEASKMFPAPMKGMTQHILYLPKKQDEANYRIEFEIGQTKVIDCNKHSLIGKINQHSVKGWGYNYYQVDSIAPGPSTMRACMKFDKKEAFVRLPSDLMLRYNSRVPFVFYLPEKAELRYRVWEAQSPFQMTK